MAALFPLLPVLAPRWMLHGTPPPPPPSPVPGPVPLLLALAPGNMLHCTPLPRSLVPHPPTLSASGTNVFETFSATPLHLTPITTHPPHFAQPSAAGGFACPEWFAASGHHCSQRVLPLTEYMVGRFLASHAWMYIIAMRAIYCPPTWCSKCIYSRLTCTLSAITFSFTPSLRCSTAWHSRPGHFYC